MGRRWLSSEDVMEMMILSRQSRPMIDTFHSGALNGFWRDCRGLGPGSEVELGNLSQTRIALWCALSVLALQHVPGAGLREERIKSMGVIGLNQCMQPHVMSRGAGKVVCMTVTSRMMR